MKRNFRNVLTVFQERRLGRYEHQTIEMGTDAGINGPTVKKMRFVFYLKIVQPRAALITYIRLQIPIYTSTD